MAGTANPMPPVEHRPAKVVLLGHTAALGGAEIALIRLLTGVDRTRFSPTVVLFAEGPATQRLRDAGETVIVVPLADTVGQARRDELGRSAALRAGLSTLTFSWRLRRTLRQLKPDLVHTNSMKAHLLGGVVARSLRLPVVCYVHDRISEDYLPRPVAAGVRLFLRRVPSQLLVNSQATAATLQPLPADRWSLAYPGIDIDQFVAKSDPAADGTQEPPVIGILGRISPTKGQEIFVRAAALLAKSHPGVRYRILGAALFGEQAYEARVRRVAGELGLAESVEFTGWVTDPAPAVARLSMLVHASPVPEPFGQVLVEAMAARVPVIATRAGGVTEILTGGDGLAPDQQPVGLLVTPGDVAGLAAAMAQVLDDPVATGRRVAAGHDRVRQRFTVARMADSVMTGWDRALNPKQ